MIDTSEARPIQQPPRRIPPPLLEEGYKSINVTNEPRQLRW